jgi:Holliday junction resolvase RusA-like endonuclease
VNIRDILITGRSARLPGDLARQDGPQVQSTAPDTAAGRSGAGTGELRLDLGWPPSINSYWQLGVNPKTRQRLLKVSAAGKAYTARTKHLVRDQYRYAPLDCRVAVLIEAWAPTGGPYGNDGWDVDNREKPLLDALTKAGLWTDDKVVRDLRIVDRGRCAGGRVVVWVRPLKG